MDNSTEGVTLYAGFILDLLHCFEKSRSTYAMGLFDMAPPVDPGDPTAPVPIQIYNDMCQWIEDNIGTSNVRKAGIAIGNRAYDKMLESGMLSTHPTPLEIMQGLKAAADVMIQDPRGRSWGILEARDGRIVIRRNQTFNCMLQEGLLKSLVERTGVRMPRAEHVACTREGAEYCDYAITWWA